MQALPEVQQVRLGEPGVQCQLGSGIGDHVVHAGRAGEQAVAQGLLQRPREQVVVPLYPLQVRAVSDVLPGTPELQELHPVDVVLALAQVEPRLGVVHREGQADVDAADIVDDLHDARVAHLDEVVQPDVGLLLDRLP